MSHVICCSLPGYDFQIRYRNHSSTSLFSLWVSVWLTPHVRVCVRGRVDLFNQFVGSKSFSLPSVSSLFPSPLSPFTWRGTAQWQPSPSPFLFPCHSTFPPTQLFLKLVLFVIFVPTSSPDQFCPVRRVSTVLHNTLSYILSYCTVHPSKCVRVHQPLQRVKAL